MKSIWPPVATQTIEDHWESESHRRMFFMGQVNVKVHGMFQLSPLAEPPEAALACAALWLWGLECMDAEKYAESDAQAMRVYEAWRASRTVN